MTLNIKALGSLGRLLVNDHVEDEYAEPSIQAVGVEQKTFHERGNPHRPLQPNKGENPEYQSNKRQKTSLPQPDCEKGAQGRYGAFIDLEDGTGYKIALPLCEDELKKEIKFLKKFEELYGEFPFLVTNVSPERIEMKYGGVSLLEALTNLPWKAGTLLLDAFGVLTGFHKRGGFHGDPHFGNLVVLGLDINLVDFATSVLKEGDCEESKWEALKATDLFIFLKTIFKWLMKATRDEENAKTVSVGLSALRVAWPWKSLKQGVQEYRDVYEAIKLHQKNVALAQKEDFCNKIEAASECIEKVLAAIDALAPALVIVASA